MSSSSTTPARPAPYPAETRAKGWRFELDMERARQSDTWTLASPEVRPWLLLLWATAWEQTPCGSLPDDAELIAARLGMPPKLFAKCRPILLRKWWKADDGRLYHDVLVQRVGEMMERRRKESDRKALARARAAGGGGQTPPPVPRDGGGTPAGIRPESGTGTGTGTGEGKESSAPRAGAGSVDNFEDDGKLDGVPPTAAGLVCRAMKARGLSSVNPGDPTLLALLAQGATAEEFDGLTVEAVEKGKGFRWVLVALQNRREEASRLVLAPGAPPVDWRETRAGIVAKGVELGVGSWEQSEWERGEAPDWPTYRARVMRAAGELPAAGAVDASNLVRMVPR